MQDHSTLRTSIPSQLLKRTLMIGFSLALIGILGLLYGGIYAHLAELQFWGFTLFILSIGLITMGMLPYRRLTRLQLKPNELCMVAPDQLEYYSKGRKLLTIPLQSIDHFGYVNRYLVYGVTVWLKPDPKDPVLVHQGRSEVDVLRYKGQKLAGADLFFSYFNQRSFQELIDWQKAEEG